MLRRIMGGMDLEAGMRRMRIFAAAFLSKFEIRFGFSVERGVWLSSTSFAGQWGEARLVLLVLPIDSAEFLRRVS